MLTPSEEEHKTTNNNLSYMIFGLGIVLIVVGIYLSTYSTVGMINQTVQLPYGGVIYVPAYNDVYPYQSIGIPSGIFAFVLIGVAVYRMKK
jgi:hypothetical protein